MTTDLFREEAVAARTERLLGEVALTQPLAGYLLTALALAAALALFGFAWWGEYTRKSHVSGYLAPDRGLIKVFPHDAGTVVERWVGEGQPVGPGDILFVISTERSAAGEPQVQAAVIAQARQRLESLQHELANQVELDRGEELAMRARLRALEAEAGQLQGEIATQQERLASAEETALRYRDLAGRKFVAALQAQEKTDTLLDQKFKLQELQHRRIELGSDVDGARSDLALQSTRAENRRSVIQREIAELSQQLTEQESRREILITAPLAGRVTTILAEPGQQVLPGKPLLSILPDGAMLEAHLLVPSRAIGFVAPEQSVAIRYQAFPHERFGAQGGRVKEISRTLLTPAEANGPVPLQESAYRVTVGLESQAVSAYGKAVPLQAGMLLDADIRLERRRLIEWVFEPVLSMAGRL